MSYRTLRITLPGLLLVLLMSGGLSMQSVLSRDESTPDLAASPEGTTGLAIEGSDDGLLRTGSGGLFRSDDQGQSWVPLALPDDLNPEKIREVATTMAASSSLYAAGPGAGIVRSDDRGQTWRTISDDLPTQEVGAFAVHTYLPDTLYAWIEGEGVFRTEDGGGRWELMDEGPPGPIAALAHSTYEGSMNTGWLYAATPDGPYLSMDCF